MYTHDPFLHLVSNKPKGKALSLETADNDSVPNLVQGWSKNVPSQNRAFPIYVQIKTFH